MRGLVRRIAMPAVIAALVLGGAAGPASAVDGDKPEPGLPFIDCPVDPPIAPQPVNPPFNPPCSEGNVLENFNSWYNFAQVGLTGSVKAQQWTQIPLTLVAANGLFYYRQNPGRRPGDKTGNELQYLARNFFVSPDGSSDDYGTSAPITVRTLAFGAIPAEVTLTIRQRRDGDDLPVPLTATPHDYGIRPPADRKDLDYIKVVEPTTLDDKINIVVEKVVVDGVDAGLEEGCGTGPEATLSASSDRVTLEEPRRDDVGGSLFDDEFFDPLIHQFATLGGTLFGKVDIPAFGRCTTRTGDDLGPLLTSALSAKDNPVTIRLGAFTCATYTAEGTQPPIAPGVNDPRDPSSGCGAAIHPNPKVVTIPQQVPIPDTPVEPVTDEE